LRIQEIKTKVIEMCSDRFEINDTGDFINKMMTDDVDNVHNKKILRIRRLGIHVDCWKTVVLIEIDTDDDNYLKIELKEAINWIASIKESLIGSENSDLYLFLALNYQISKEECLRIEATEQFCRKYVILPDEDIAEFVNRTFLQKYVDSTKQNGSDPVERAFAKTVESHSWLTPEMQKKWKKALLSLNGSELIDELLEGEV